MPVNIQYQPRASGGQLSIEPSGHADGSIDGNAGPFDEVAQTLLENGYAPIPLIGKRPIELQWTRWCRRQPTAEEIAEGKGKGRNVGVAMGLDQLIGIDIDCDDIEIETAVRSVIGEGTVAKRGSGVGPISIACLQGHHAGAASSATRVLTRCWSRCWGMAGNR